MISLSMFLNFFNNFNKRIIVFDVFKVCKLLWIDILQLVMPKKFYKQIWPSFYVVLY